MWERILFCARLHFCACACQLDCKRCGAALPLHAPSKSMSMSIRVFEKDVPPAGAVWGNVWVCGHGQLHAQLLGKHWNEVCLDCVLHAPCPLRGLCVVACALERAQHGQPRCRGAHSVHARIRYHVTSSTYGRSLFMHVHSTCTQVDGRVCQCCTGVPAQPAPPQCPRQYRCARRGHCVAGKPRKRWVALVAWGVKQGFFRGANLQLAVAWWFAVEPPFSDVVCPWYFDIYLMWLRVLSGHTCACTSRAHAFVQLPCAVRSTFED